MAEVLKQEISPRRLVVSPEAAAIAVGYDRLVAALDVPIVAYQRLALRLGACRERLVLRKASRQEAAERRQVQVRIWTGVIKRVGGEW